MTRNLRSALVLVAALTLAACGPGGERSGEPAAAQEKPTARATNTAASG